MYHLHEKLTKNNRKKCMTHKHAISEFFCFAHSVQKILLFMGGGVPNFIREDQTNPPPPQINHTRKKGWWRNFCSNPISQNIKKAKFSGRIIFRQLTYPCNSVVTRIEQRNERIFMKTHSIVWTGKKSKYLIFNS